MPLDFYQCLKTAFGLFSFGSGLFLTINSVNDQRKVKKLQKFFIQAQNLNLNQTSIKQLSQKLKNPQKLNQSYPATIQKVTAHFSNRTSPQVFFKSNSQDEEFTCIDCQTFQVVEKIFNRNEYQVYQIQVKDTLASQNVLIPDQREFISNSKSTVKGLIPTILASASTLGIVGTLTLNSNSNKYIIEAKIIGASLNEISKYIEKKKFKNNFQIFLGGILTIIGIGCFFKIYQAYQKSRIRTPLEASLLINSQQQQ